LSFGLEVELAAAHVERVDMLRHWFGRGYFGRVEDLADQDAVDLY
jgi:hypothetical protein